MKQVAIGTVETRRLCIGGNPFSGFAHQTAARAREMTEYYTPDRIKATLRRAENAGIDTFFGRTDDHIMGILADYWAEGGEIKWFAQICKERDDPDAWRGWLDRAVKLGASAAYIHGGIVDNWYANGAFDLFREALSRMRDAGITAGFAGHDPAAHEWIREHLDCDFQMCSYYNPTDRSRNADHSDVGEKWEIQDRDRMLAIIATIERPVVHYKVFAAGNRPIIEGFRTMGASMRPGDIACVGMFVKDDPDMIEKNIESFDAHVEAAVART